MKIRQFPNTSDEKSFSIAFQCVLWGQDAILRNKDNGFFLSGKKNAKRVLLYKDKGVIL
jgi:hypothetical protein